MHHLLREFPLILFIFFAPNKIRLFCTNIFWRSSYSTHLILPSKQLHSMMSFWCPYCFLWTYFIPFFKVSIVDFEDVNLCWVYFSYISNMICKQSKDTGKEDCDILLWNGNSNFLFLSIRSTNQSDWQSRYKIVIFSSF